MLILLYLLLMVAVSDELPKFPVARTTCGTGPSYRPMQVNSTFG